VRTEVAVINNRTGEPVIGLTQNDFTVLENGTRQEIASFIALNPEGIATAGDRPSRNRRVFLLVFGSGHLPGPVQPFDGAIEFLRERLGPTDLAAVMAWNRVTELTTDHARLVTVVDRLRKLPTEVLLAAYRDASMLRDLSPATQAAIDAWIAPIEGSDNFLRSATALLLGTSVYRRDVSEAFPWNRRIAGRDLLKVYAGIEYLRNVEGQKHLVLLSREGLSPPVRFVDPGAFHSSAEDDRRLATHANDAGVALDLIHTRGTAPNTPNNLSGHFSSISSQQVASESGGQFTSVRTASEQLARLDAATRSGYILGYVPSNPNMDGKYRAIDVRVDRKDVTIVYRRGYTARPDPARVDPRELMTRIRMREAAGSVFLVEDLKMTVVATATGPAGARQVRVDVTIDPSKLSLTQAEGRWMGSIDLMILCSDPQDKIVGGLDQHMNLSMAPALFEQAKAGGIPYTASVPVSGSVRRVKVIVYNFESDRLGVTSVAVK
jgi:VWFA-related protein